MAALWTKESLGGVTVGFAANIHIHDLATILSSAQGQSTKFEMLYNKLKLTDMDLAELETIQTRMLVKLQTPYSGYTELINKWKSLYSRFATFGVLFDALTEINWNKPIDAILAFNWENVQPGDSIAGDDETEARELVNLNEDVTDGIERGIDWVDGSLPPLDVQVVPAKNLREGPEYYKMTSNPRGLVLIINNEFKGTKDERQGSTLDVKCIQKLFSHMNYTVYGVSDIKKKELKPTLKTFKKLITKDIDSVVIVMMSHGQLGSVLMDCGGIVNIYSGLIDEFSHEKCPIMKNKPKIFLFQACQVFSKEQKDGVDNLHTSDVLVCFPTYPGQPAYRRPGVGSRYIYALSKVIMENAHSQDIKYMLDKMVVEEMDKMNLGKTSDRQVPCVFHIGRWLKLYFNPGL